MINTFIVQYYTGTQRARGSSLMGHCMVLLSVGMHGLMSPTLMLGARGVAGQLGLRLC